MAGVVIYCHEFDEFGYGSCFEEALKDLSETLDELISVLENDTESLGGRLAEMRGTIDEAKYCQFCRIALAVTFRSPNVPS